jgi:hypothetical protein
MNLTLLISRSEKYYPNNPLTKFKTHLVQPLNFEDEHEVALTELFFPTQWGCSPSEECIMIVALCSAYSEEQARLLQEWKRGCNDDMRVLHPVK